MFPLQLYLYLVLLLLVSTVYEVFHLKDDLFGTFLSFQLIQKVTGKCDLQSL